MYLKRLLCILITVLLACSLMACAKEEAQSAPEPTPNPLETYSGKWTWEFGDGSIEWSFYDDGRVLVPEQVYDEYRRIGGFGTWNLTENGISVSLADTYSVPIVEEDGFTKLYFPPLNQTLVRVEEREAAYGEKYVDVELSEQNIWDYFRMEKVPSPVDENGERIYKEVFVMRSVPYDSGLFYWAEEDVRLDFVYWTTYHLRAERAPYGVNFYVNNFNSVDARGKMTFVKADHVDRYSYDGKQRVVVLKSGETMSESFDAFRYGNYPY